MVPALITVKQSPGGKRGAGIATRLYRGLAFGLFATCAGWVMFGVVIALLDDGGANEHAPRTIVEFVLNTFWAVFQWPIIVATKFLPDNADAQVPLFWLLMFVYSCVCWGFVFELARTGIKALKRKLSPPVPKP
jgi:hypothetical protein